MAFRINTNVQSLAGQRSLNRTTHALSRNFSKLSSGLRIERAADDSAGIAISERMRAQVRALRQAERNAGDGVSVVETTEGGLSNIQSILQRMKELATESANGTNAASDKDALQTEFGQLSSEVTRIAKSTEFNGKVLLDGTTTTLALQVGDGTTANVDTITLTLSAATEGALSIGALNVGASGDASAAITAIDNAIQTVNANRATLGAFQNRLGNAVDSISQRIQNLSAAESRIRDVDFASEMADLTRNQILQQAGTAMLAQANAAPQLALQLLQ